MQDPFAELGVARDATTQQVRAAYHAKVKHCHPDCQQGESAQCQAQEALVRLNLAYEEAMRKVSQRACGQTDIALPNAMQLARKLMEQHHCDAALRMLSRAAERDEEFFSLQGQILLRMGQPDAAHTCFRAAIRLAPDNAAYRAAALEAVVAARRQQTVRGRMEGFARRVFGRAR